MTQNPDWSRESMKSILAWGWVSPTGKDHVGQRKDKTHDAMAYELGLGTWIQAVKAGWVRYIIFSDNHMGLTAIISPATLAAAQMLVEKPEVITVSFEWLVDGRIKMEGSAGLTVKEALAVIRAKRREQNPYFAGGVSTYGWIDKQGKLVRAKAQDANHQDIAARMGYDENVPRGTDPAEMALDDGCVRYLIDETNTLYMEIRKGDKETWKRVLAGLEIMPSVIETVEVDVTHGEPLAVRGLQRAIVRVRGMIRTANPLTLTPTHRSQAVGNKFHTLVEMTPMEFLRLTTVNDRQIKEIMDSAKPLATYNDAAREERNIIPAFLALDISSGSAKVMGHEGRHRAAALFLNGEEGIGMPVYLHITDAHPGQAQKMLDKLDGGRQKWMWDTKYLWGWDELPSMLIGQFNKLVKVPKSRLRVIEPYVQDRGKKARGL